MGRSLLFLNQNHYVATNTTKPLSIEHSVYSVITKSVKTISIDILSKLSELSESIFHICSEYSQCTHSYICM